jgi:pullulanase
MTRQPWRADLHEPSARNSSPQPFFARRRYFDGRAELGAIYSPECTVFRVFAPSAERVKVVVADGLAGADGLAEHAMSPAGKGIWEVTIPGDTEGRCYAYKLAGPGLDPDREVVDIYATCTQGDASRSLIVDPRKTDPPGFRESRFTAPAPASAINYELHVATLPSPPTRGQAPGAKPGLTEAATHFPRHPEVSTA